MSQVVERRRSQAARTVVLSAEVVARTRISSSFARVTLAGEGLAHLEDVGYDHWFRLFLPREHEGGLSLPADPVDPGWYGHFRSAAAEDRPVMRYVTVRDYRSRPSGTSGGGYAELDVDVVIHGHPDEQRAGSEEHGSQPGPLSSWAQTATPGQRVALLDQGTIFRPAAVASEVILLGDETAVPAIAGIARALGRHVRGRALIEVPQADDVQELPAPPGLELTWLPRGSAPPGDLALSTFREHLGVPQATHPYLYAAGESSMIRTLNVLLRDEFAWPQQSSTTVIYWHDSRRETPPENR